MNKATFKKTTKELSFCHKLWFYNRHIFSTWLCKPLIFQTNIIWSKMIHSLKYRKFPTFECKDIRITKSEFVTKTQFLWVLPETVCCDFGYNFFLTFFLTFSTSAANLFSKLFISFQQQKLFKFFFENFLNLSLISSELPYKFGPDRLSRFDVSWILQKKWKTNGQVIYIKTEWGQEKK